jgi:hypothetical protein
VVGREHGEVDFLSRYRRPNREFQRICDLADRRVVAVLQCIDVLVPGLDTRRKKRLANRILTLCDRKDRSRKLHPAALYEMFEHHSQCVKTQEGKCPLLVFTTELAEELNEYFNSEAE